MEPDMSMCSRVTPLWACAAPKLAPSLPFHVAQGKEKIDVLVRDRLSGYLLVGSAQEGADVVPQGLIQACRLRRPVSLSG
jgi:hypothetical protein